MKSLVHVAAVCIALTLGACATSHRQNEPRLGLRWNGELITWTVENPHPHRIVIDDYTAVDMGVPQGVWIRVTDAAGGVLRGSVDSEWYSPWLLWSSLPTYEPLELASGTRLEHTFSAADLTMGFRMSETIASQPCRYQVQVAVARRVGRRWASTSLTSDWKEIECSALQIQYCPRDEQGVLDCTRPPTPTPAGRRPED